MEKKKNDQEITEKIEKLEEILKMNSNELENTEEEMKKHKNNKKIYKIQLRDLYQKILKDEHELL